MYRWAKSGVWNVRAAVIFSMSQTLTNNELKGGIKGAGILAMIDSGASRNFVSKKLIYQLVWKWMRVCVLGYIWEMDVVFPVKRCVEGYVLIFS